MPSTFPILLGRPWLYRAKEKFNWAAQKLTLGQSKITLNWSKEPHHGETDSEDGYNSEYSSTALVVNISKFHKFSLEVEEAGGCEIS